MSWLMRSATEVLDLAADREALEGLSVLSGWLLADNHAIGSARTPLEALRGLGRADAAVVSAIADVLGRSPSGHEVADILASLRALVAALGDRLPELGVLTCPWDSLDGPAGLDQPAVLRWPALPGVAFLAPARLEPICLSVAGFLEQGVIFDTRPEFPAGSIAVGAAAARLGLQGSVQAEAQLGIPLRLGAVGLSGGGASTARIDWLVARGPDRLVADTFRAAIDFLTNPFDLAALSTAFAQPRLLAVRVVTGGASDLSGSLQVGVADLLATLPGGQLGVTLAFHSSRHVGLLFDARPGTADAQGQRSVRIDLRRADRDAETTSAAVGLTFDLTTTLEGLRPAVLQKTGKAQALFAELETYIPPSRAIRDRLRQALADNVTAPALRALLAMVLGDSPAVSDLDRLRLRLESQLDAQTDLWRADAADLADRVAERALDGLALAPHDRVLLRSLVQAAVRPALEALGEDLSRDLRQRAADTDTGAWGRLTAALGQLGVGLDAGLRRADALSAPVIAQLDRLQGAFGRIAEAIRYSGEVKLNARWRREARLSQGHGVDLSLEFHPQHPEAADLFRRLVTGSLEGLFDDLTAAAGGAGGTDPVTLIAGTMQAFAEVHAQSGLDLTLLDFRLGNAALLDAEVVIEIDVSGNIRVCTKAESHWRQWRPSERCDFAAINVFELATARQTRHMSLSLSLSQVHQDLRDDEIQEFFDGLADARIALLTRDQVRAALGQLPPRETRRAGELRVWFELDETNLLRLLRITAADPGAARPGLTEQERNAIYDTAIDAMVAGLQTTGSRTDYTNLRDYVKSQGRGEDLAAALKSMRSAAGRAALAPSPVDDAAAVTTQPQYDRLLGIVKRADGLCTTVASMREIYLSAPGARWRPDEYRQRQRDIDAAIVYWVRGVPMDRGWWAFLTGGDSIGPYMLAFFKAIAELCKAPAAGAGAPALRAGIVISQAGQTREIPLAGGEPPLAADPPAQSVPAAPLGSAGASSTTTEPSPGTGERRTQTMPKPKFIFPLPTKVNTYQVGGRKFRAARPGGRLHAGCDLIVPTGTHILAMADGMVQRGPAYFYEGTYALEVIHDNGMLVRYGEIGQLAPKGIKAGARVKQGDLIATVGRLNSGSHMLHLEMYSNGSAKGALTVSGFNRFQRRADVMDPTPELDAAPVWAAVQAGPPAEAPPPEKTPAAPGALPKPSKGRVDPLKVLAKLNVRARPEVTAGAASAFFLSPGDPVEILEDVRGGAYPFGQGNLWFRIRHEGREGYVVAWFIETDYAVGGATGLNGLAESVGYVRRLEGGLNVRTAASADASVVEKLAEGAKVALLSQETGGTYASNRNDWLRVRTEANQEGCVAAYYIAIGAPDAAPGAAGECVDWTRWERVLADTQWAGASDRTARNQLGQGVPGGTAASQRLAEQDLHQVKQLAGVFQDVAAKFGVPAALLAGLASRESRCGKALDRSGWGDRGNGFGIMQVDRNAHPNLYTADPRGVEHIEEATGILAKNLASMLAMPPFRVWEDRYLLQGATAAYNFGIGNVRSKDQIDKGSTGDDYGADTLARAQFYLRHPDLDLLHP